MDISAVLFSFMHLDSQVLSLFQAYGALIYGLLFAVFFAETGLVITPFLPGDSLIFALGALAKIGYIDIFILFFVISAAAILGDTVNYWIGRKIGPKIFTEDSRYFKKKYALQAKDYYDNQGGRIIVFARFIPIVRTYAPFIAGVSKMSYKNFMAYNIWGGIGWVLLWLICGHWLGGIKLIQDNFVLFSLIIMSVSFLPFAYEPTNKWIKKRLELHKAAKIVITA